MRFAIMFAMEEQISLKDKYADFLKDTITEVVSVDYFAMLNIKESRIGSKQIDERVLPKASLVLDESFDKLKNVMLLDNIEESRIEKFIDDIYIPLHKELKEKIYIKYHYEYPPTKIVLPIAIVLLAAAVLAVLLNYIF